MCVQTYVNTSNGVYDMNTFTSMEVDDSINAVIVGLDVEIDYQKLSYASVLIQAGRRFLASNSDTYDPRPEGIFPGNGAIVEALITATGQQPEVIGKPYPTQIDVFMTDKGLSDKSKILVIGDRLDTDIELGKNAKVDSALVLTGIATMKDVESAKKNNQTLPTYILDSLQI